MDASIADEHHTGDRQMSLNGLATLYDRVKHRAVDQKRFENASRDLVALHVSLMSFFFFFCLRGALGATDCLRGAGGWDLVGLAGDGCLTSAQEVTTVLEAWRSPGERACTNTCSPRQRRGEYLSSSNRNLRCS